LWIKSGFHPEPPGAPTRRLLPRVLFFVFALFMLTPIGIVMLVREPPSLVGGVICLSWPVVYVCWRLFLCRLDRGRPES